jgi:hypothetical protein
MDYFSCCSSSSVSVQADSGMVGKVEVITTGLGLSGMGWVEVGVGRAESVGGDADSVGGCRLDRRRVIQRWSGVGV